MSKPWESPGFSRGGAVKDFTTVTLRCKIGRRYQYIRPY